MPTVEIQKINKTAVNTPKKPKSGNVNNTNSVKKVKQNVQLNFWSQEKVKN
jgi:hypothetical protein